MDLGFDVGGTGGGRWALISFWYVQLGSRPLRLLGAGEVQKLTPGVFGRVVVNCVVECPCDPQLVASMSSDRQGLLLVARPRLWTKTHLKGPSYHSFQLFEKRSVLWKKYIIE